VAASNSPHSTPPPARALLARGSTAIEGLGTLGLPEPVLRDLAAKADFAQVRHVEMDNPFNSLYELTR
jgi:hypothetical protein